jgi:class 3 adenylate cyclase
MKHHWLSAEQYRNFDEINEGLQKLAWELFRASRKHAPSLAGDPMGEGSIDLNVLKDLVTSEIQCHNDPITVLASICRLLIRLGDRNSIQLAFDLSHRIHDLERAAKEPSPLSYLLKGVCQIGLKRTDIGIKNVSYALAATSESSLLSVDRGLGYWALVSAAIENRNLCLALTYSKDWLRAAEEGHLDNEVLHSKMVICLLHLLQGDEEGCLADFEVLAADISNGWYSAASFLAAWAKDLTTNRCSTPTPIAEPYPLLLGLDWQGTGPSAGDSAAEEFGFLCGTRRRLCNEASLGGLETDEILKCASLYAKWELLKPLSELEEILKDGSMDAYIRFNMARVLGRYAMEEIFHGTSRESDAGLRSDALILVSDVRNYSTLCEKHPPHEIFALMSPLFRTMNEELESAGGMILQFTGDCIMVVFNTFKSQQSEFIDILFHTVRSLKRLLFLNSLSRLSGRPEVNVGVGINKGIVAVGYHGGLSRCTLTVLGNTANVAARIESKTKEMPGTVLISKSCLDDGEPDFWRNPQRINFAVRDMKQVRMQGISKTAHLYSVAPLLRYWVDFVPMGFVARPEEGVVYLDTGNSGEPGILDHHSVGQQASSSCELLVRNPEMLKGHLDGTPPSQIEFRLHGDPDLDCTATLYSAQELLDLEPREWILEKLAAYVSQIDQGTIPHPDELAESLYGIFVAHLHLTESNQQGKLTDYQRLEAGMRVVDAAAYIMEKNKHDADLPHIFQFEPDWFPEERRLIREDRIRYREDFKLRGQIYRACVRGRHDPVAGLWLDHPQSLLFKLWARTDSRAPGGKGFSFLAIDWSNEQRNRFIISVDPDSETHLEGLGELLESHESAERKRLGKERSVHPIRPPADNSDPWYFGWGHGYTIVDSPRDGTILTAEEVRKIHESWQPEE